MNGRTSPQQALELVKAEFDLPPPGPDDKTIFDHLVKNAPAPQMVAEKGSLADGEKLAAAVVAPEVPERLRGARGHRDLLGAGAASKGPKRPSGPARRCRSA